MPDAALTGSLRVSDRIGFLFNQLDFTALDFFQTDLMAVVPDFVQQLADRVGDLDDTPWLLCPLLLHHEVGDERWFHAP